jgi:hypothetical protein
MYTYLRNVGPLFFMEFSFLHGVLIFSKVGVSDSKLWWLFRSCLLESYLVTLTTWKDLISSYFFVLPPLSQELPILPNGFYQMFLIAHSLIMPPSIQFGFGDEAIWRFGFWHGVVFMQNFWNFKAFPQTEIILTSIQSRLILKKFKWFLWRGFQMWSKRFVLIFWWKIWSDIWLVTKRLKFQFEG